MGLFDALKKADILRSLCVHSRRCECPRHEYDQIQPAESDGAPDAYSEVPRSRGKQDVIDELHRITTVFRHMISHDFSIQETLAPRLPRTITFRRHLPLGS
jgi:hypothetical protein